MLEYLDVLARIGQSGINSNISIKLTQFGLEIDPALAYRNARRVVEDAARRGNFVRVDMESSAYTARRTRERMGKRRGCLGRRSFHACQEHAGLPVEQGEHLGLQMFFTHGHARKVREIDNRLAVPACFAGTVTAS